MIINVTRVTNLDMQFVYIVEMLKSFFEKSRKPVGNTSDKW